MDDFSGVRASESNMRDIRRMLLRCVDIDDGVKHWKAKTGRIDWAVIVFWRSTVKVIECVALCSTVKHSPTIVSVFVFLYITDAYKTWVNFSLFLFFFPLSSKNCFQIFFHRNDVTVDRWKNASAFRFFTLFFFLSLFLSFFLFVYIGREYTCIYVDMRIAFRLVRRRADMLILQLWVDRIVWERCPCCNMRWWSKTCAEMEDFCMKLRPFDRVMAVNRLFSSLLFRRVCFLLPSFSSFLLLLLLFFLHFSLSLRLLPFYRKFARESRSCYALDAFLLLFCFLSRFAFFSFVFSLFYFSTTVM